MYQHINLANMNSICIPNKIFNSLDFKHQIEISIIGDIAWFNINKLNYEFCKTFLILLKDVIEFISENKAKYIKQYLNKDDLEYYTKSSFVEEDLEKSVYCASTKLEDFVEEIANALGIKKI